jgi:hypothetical protein
MAAATDYNGILQANAACLYYFFMAVVVIRYETKATASRALTFIVRVFVDDTIAITVWTNFCFHLAAPAHSLVGDRRIPIIKRTGEVLKTQEGKCGARPEATVSIGFVARLQKFSWGGRVAGNPLARHDRSSAGRRRPSSTSDER